MSSLIKFRREAWGLEKVLFSVKPPAEPFRHKVFAARDKEFERAEVAVLDAPRNLLISGLFGIGKTIFIKELLSGLAETSEVLTVYTCLDDRNSDFLTTILRGLAHELRDEDDEAATLNRILTGAEITEQAAHKGTFSGEGGLAGILKASGLSEDSTSETVARKSVTNAAWHIQGLIDRATERFPERRLIVAIDDLDKRDPATVLAALIEARSTLHTDCAFILTGHPLGMLRNIYSTAGGIFDSQINLEVLSSSDMRTILVNYLEAGRSKETPHHGIHPFTEEAVEVVLRRSLGIPRLLNKICQQILEKAGDLRSPIVDMATLQECWTQISVELRRAMSPEVADLLTVLREQTGNFAAPQVPDDIYERLGIDSHQQLLTLLSAAVTEDIAVGLESAGQTRFLPNPLFEDLPKQNLTDV